MTSAIAAVPRLQQHRQARGDQHDPHGITCRQLHQLHQARVGVKAAARLLDDADGDEDQSETEHDLSHAAQSFALGELIEHHPCEHQPRRIVFQAQGDEQDHDGEADVGPEHDRERASAVEVAVLNRLDREDGDGGAGRGGHGDREARAEGAHARVGELLHPIAEARAEQAVEPFAQKAGGEDDQGHTASDGQQ